MISVKISATVYPTEDPEKVIKAVSDLFTGIELQKENVDTKEPEKGVSPFFHITGEGGLDLLYTLHGLIRREQIIDSIRNKVFNKGLSSEGLSVSFLLNKQAAFVGVPSVPAEEEPLGSIEVTIRQILLRKWKGFLSGFYLLPKKGYRLLKWEWTM
ncbi:RNA-binding domain-containing protein [Methanosarcina horonobensis]|uniref:RNA-binding domain-containing protein n=1 Tax=Methanosarcina horonobensis TaxID=418008 RepID=UPI000A82E560|nr:RNA-binding domain-containing protein [Methanosarcina horonobensis]